MMTMMMVNIFCEMVERRKSLTLFLVGTTLRDFQHRKSLIHRKQDLSLRRTSVQSLLKEFLQ